MNLLLPPPVEKHMKQFIAQPTQTLIITGPSGSGKNAIAHHLIAQILATNDVNAHPYVKQVTSRDDKSIGIEQVRELEAFLKLKVPGSADYDRAILLADGQRLTEEAQNALLKTLEEPPSGTLIIVTTDNLQALLPTIRSRAQLLTVSVPTKATVVSYFDGAHSAQEVEQAYKISGGLPGLMQALLSNDAHPLREAVETARRLLQAPAYEKTLMVDGLSKDTAALSQVLLLLEQMAHISLQNAEEASAERWQHIYRTAYDISVALKKNAQPKLVTTSLALSL